MAELTATKIVGLDTSAGTKKTKVFTVVPQADGDTVPLATWFSSIDSAESEIIAGLDANFTHLITSVSGTTLTIAQKKADGSTAADDWTAAVIQLKVTGEDEALSV